MKRKRKPADPQAAQGILQYKMYANGWECRFNSVWARLYIHRTCYENVHQLNCKWAGLHKGKNSALSMYFNLEHNE